MALRIVDCLPGGELPRIQRIVIRAVWEPAESWVQGRALGWTAQRHLMPKLITPNKTKGRPNDV